MKEGNPNVGRACIYSGLLFLSQLIMLSNNSIEYLSSLQSYLPDAIFLITLTILVCAGPVA